MYHVRARNRSLLSCSVLSSLPLLFSFTAVRTLSPLRVTDDDRNNSCPIFSPAGAARRGATHVSTCVCESLRNTMRNTAAHTACDLHAAECIRRTICETPPSFTAFTLDEVYAVAVVKAPGNYRRRGCPLLLELCRRIILTVRHRLQICRRSNRLFPD